MALTIPDRKAVVDALRTYVRTDLSDIDPSTERRSFIGGLVKSIGSGLEDWYLALKRFADFEPWPQTATGGFLTGGWWVPVTKLTQNPASSAAGFVAITGTAGTTVADGLQLQGTAGSVYTVLVSTSIVAQSFAAAELTYVPGTNRCVFITTAPVNHLATGMSVTISGASPSAYNGTFTITVTDDADFYYTPASTPGVNTATGSPLATATFAAAEIECNDTGEGGNVSSGGVLSIVSPPSGMSSTAIVTAAGIGGGTDAETLEAYRARILQALGTDFGTFSAAEIEIVAKTVPGVTRVMIRTAQVTPVPGWPYEGQVKIAFLRDNDANPLPTAQEVADVKGKIVDTIMPAHVAEDDVIVMSPPPYQCDFAFSSITPDTPGMRDGIKAVLRQYFTESAEWGAPVTTDDYRCVILTAYDSATRQKLKRFTLTSPTTDITIGVDDYPVLGTVTFG